MKESIYLESGFPSEAIEKLDIWLRSVLSEIRDVWTASDWQWRVFVVLLVWLSLNLLGICLAWRKYGHTINSISVDREPDPNQGNPKERSDTGTATEVQEQHMKRD